MNIFKLLVFCFFVAVATSISAKGPEITHISWGKVMVKHADGSEHQYKDCKVYPSGSKEWNWGQTGTRHNPGIQSADLKDFIDEVEVVILTRGMDLVLLTQPETLDYLKSLGKTYYVEQTEKAVALYNKLNNQGKKVAILIHSTC